MKITFIGADHTVTGSRHLVEINNHKVLLDCGMFQGKRDEARHVNSCFPFEPSDIDAVILSHAHIDHSGNLPNLVKHGFNGPIYTTHATKDLCEYMLMDSAYIQERNIEYINKKRGRKDQSPLEPLYTQDDTEICLQQFVGKDYYKPFEVVEGLTITFYDAGHILGSALSYLELHDKETDEKVKFLFTGDLGRPHLPILRDPDLDKMPPVDYLLIESTYGNKFHESIVEVQDKLAEIITETAAKGGKIIIPAFSLGRTQEITYEIQRLVDKGMIPSIPVFLDSPLAVNVTEVFKAHSECYDKDVKDFIADDTSSLFAFDNFKQTQSVDDSKALNEFQGTCIIISASGMCEHGRILHHLKNTIEDPKNVVMIIGYQAHNTLGRKLVEGEKNIKIFSKPYHVRAKIEVMNYFSAHADRSDLLEFTTGLKDLKKVFLVHGDTERIYALKDAMQENGLNDIRVPAWGDVFDLTLKEDIGKPRLRLGCSGQYIYDRDGKLASSDESILEDISIPGVVQVEKEQHSETKKIQAMTSPTKEKKSNFDSSGF